MMGAGVCIRMCIRPYTHVYVFPIGEYTYTHTPEYTPPAIAS